MEDFEFELLTELKEELLTQPIEKDGNQLFQRKVSKLNTWVKNVSTNPANQEMFFQARDPSFHHNPKIIPTKLAFVSSLIASPDCSQVVNSLWLLLTLLEELLISVAIKTIHVDNQIV